MYTYAVTISTLQLPVTKPDSALLQQTAIMVKLNLACLLTLSVIPSEIILPFPTPSHSQTLTIVGLLPCRP